jgi:ligand-binding sensor domain-containing protein
VSARAGLLLLLLAQAAAASAAGLDPKKALTQYNLDVWTIDDGLPQNTVTALQQTRDGYLWIGTFGGLARFDGVRFATFDKSTTPALPNSGVQALLSDKDGGLWVGTNGGGLTLLKDGTARTFTSADGLGGDVVRALHQDRRGRVWAGTNGGLSLLEGGRFRNWGAAQGFARSAVRAIREDAEGALWIGTNGDGLFRLQDGVFTRFTKKDGLPSDLVFSLQVGREARCGSAPTAVDWRATRTASSRCTASRRDSRATSSGRCSRTREGGCGSAPTALACTVSTASASMACRAGPACTATSCARWSRTTRAACGSAPTAAGWRGCATAS